MPAGFLQFVMQPTGSGFTVPDAPTDLALTAGDAQLSASWTAPVDDGGTAITDYEYRLRPDTTGIWGSATSAGGTGTSEVITGLTNGVEYDVEVRAVNAEGPGAWSTMDTETPVAPAAMFADDFTRSDSTDIASGAPVSWAEVGLPSGSETDWYIASNKLSFTPTGYYATAIAGNTGSADHYAQCVVTTANTGTKQAGVMVGMDSTGRNGFYVSCWDDRIRIYHIVSGVLNTVTDLNSSVDHNGKLVRAELVGTDLEVFVDGVSVGSTSVTSDGNYVGVAARGCIIDDFEADAL